MCQTCAYRFSSASSCSLLSKRTVLSLGSLTALISWVTSLSGRSLCIAINKQSVESCQY